MFLDREKLKTLKPKLEQVELPELDGFVYVKSLTTKQLQEAERARDEGADPLELFYLQVCCGVCDESGEPVFTPDDKELISDLPFGAVKKMSEAVNRVSGLDGPEKNSL